MNENFDPKLLTQLTDNALFFRRDWAYDIGDIDAFMNVLNEIEYRKAPINPSH